MNRTLNIEVKSHYGTMHLYPKCQESQFIADIAGTKTISHENLAKCKANGYEISYIMPNIDQLP